MKQTLEQVAEDFVWEVMENDEDGISELSKKLRPSSKISDFYDALAEFFKAGAEWQKKQDEEELESEEKLNHPLYLEGFDTGREVQKVFNELTWQDIKRIVNIADKMLDRELVKGANPITEKLYYEQVWEKYKEQKNK